MDSQNEAIVLGLASIPSSMSKWDVARHLMGILHTEEFSPPPPKRQVNFRVVLDYPEDGGLSHLGTGAVTVPSDVARKFLRWVKENPIIVDENKLRFYIRGRARERLTKIILKTPFIDPDKEEERQFKLWDLAERLRVNVVQFGILFREKYPSSDKERLSPRSFSVEWEHDAVKASAAWLDFQYDHKLVCITIGDESREGIGHTISIQLGNIERIGTGYDPNPYVCFDILTPPDFHRINFHYNPDDQKKSTKVASVHPGHEIVAPFAYHVRIVLFNDRQKDIIEKFEEMSKIAEIPTATIIRCNTIEARKFGFFTSERIYKLKKQVACLSWPVAFQLEALLHNSLLHSGDIEKLLPTVERLCRLHPDDNNSYVGLILRRYADMLRIRSPRESPAQCFERVRRDYLRLKSKLANGIFMCYHVTFTPSRILLEGPFPMQSNRIIREYEGYEDCFIRVNFSEEDKLNYRWDRRVDCLTLVDKRVGDILKSGFELSGRRFEFLAYSSSSLRDHSVWFMHPFEHVSKGYLRPGKKDRLVNANFIRETIGDFRGTELLKQPSKYAARLGQAFTATSPSVWISRDDFEEIEDIGSGDHLHTDGVGTISKSLSDAIWENIKQPGTNAVQPSAYQIRFLGYKGMVGVDPKLDEDGNGKKMRLRKSMRKFENSKAESAQIEIAASFQRPNGCHLNRPLIMFLEDLHVKREYFEALQDEAIADAKTIHNSISDFCAVLNKHSFGAPYRLSFTLKRLRDKYGLELHTKNDQSGLDTQFLKQIRRVAMLSVLREIKHRARIPVPDSFHLVGVADEGPAYEKRGYDNVFTLTETEIYACVQKSVDDPPVWLEGPCTISRSPIAHPGDIQRVTAIGKPPEDKLCLFAEMKNVVVLPSVGKRSLASMLGGGDLDGDEFEVIMYPPLLPKTWEEPAKYPQDPPFNLGRDSKVEDICDFIVEYIYSDVLGLLSVRQLIIADQSEDGVFDKDCMKLSRLCSLAVDYPKNGNKVDIDGNLPSTLIREKPDWQQAEVVDPDKLDYYDSDRALGHLYRNQDLEVETLKEEPSLPAAEIDSSIVMDPISVALGPMVEEFLGQEVDAEEAEEETEDETASLFRKYVNELSYIRSTHTISARPDSQLQEAEIVVGAILDKCTQNRYRKDRMYKMKNHTRTLVEDIERHFVDKSLEPGPGEWREGLRGAWRAWCYSQRHYDRDGAGSFGLIALGIVLDCLDNLLDW